MATSYNILVHADGKSNITCASLRGPGVNTNTVKVDDLTIFADPAELRRLVDAINARLAVIDEAARVRESEIAVSRAYNAHVAARVAA